MKSMKDKQLTLTKVVQHLMLHTSSMSDLGLLSGKMGVCIFFYKYAFHSGTKRYADFAGELMDEIYSEISTDILRDFGKGLAGICWGIEYLIRQGFVDAFRDRRRRSFRIKSACRDMKKPTMPRREILASRIDLLLKDSDFAAKLGEGARKRFLEKYEMSVFAEKMTTLYNNM